MSKRLIVEDRELGGNNLEAYYYERENLRAIAIDTDVPERRRMWELVASGMERVPLGARKRLGRIYRPGGFYFFGPVSPSGDVSASRADALAVRSISEVIDEMEPDWARAVSEARELADDIEVVSAFSGVPVEAAIAAVRTGRAPSTNVTRGKNGEDITEEVKPEDALSPGTLEGFELWDRTVRAPAHHRVKTAFVSVRVGGVVGMNKAAHKVWGEPTACRVLYDPERRRIAFEPCGPEEENSFEVFHGNVQIPCKSLFDFYGVVVHKTRRYHDPKVIDGVLVVDL